MTRKTQIDNYKDEIVGYYKSGKSLQFLQDKYKINRHTIRDRLKKWNITVFSSNSRYGGNNSSRWKGYGKISACFFHKVKHNALIRNIPFNITIEDMWNKFEEQNETCPLTGLKLILDDTIKVKTLNNTASLDRIDNSKGYTYDNIQWVHKKINIMRNKLNITEFLEMCTLVANHSKNN